jgi:hypothetical protein
MRALSANDRDLRLVNLVKTQHGLPDHCDTPSVDHTPPILRPGPGLAASLPVRYTLEVARSEISLP